MQEMQMNTENVDRIKKIENIEKIGKIKNTEKIENTEMAEKIENTEMTEKIENTDQIEKIDIKSMNLTELTNELSRIGEKAYRARQIYEWLHIKQVSDFDEMTNISKDLRNRLGGAYKLTVLRPVKVQVSKLDDTRKYLFALPDQNTIESVRMKYKHGNTVCISSQVGCRMGCRFCASTIGGLVRNLSPSEMLEQVYRIGRDLGERISNVVVMGIGEPLDNYDNLLKFIRMLTDEHGLNISQRNITVSTCGIVPRIRELADEKLQITLALSLHAPVQGKRLSLMPAAAAYDLDDVIEACDYYFAQTGRRMSYEYSLISGLNDTKEDAQALGRLLSGKNCHVNLIPVNPVRESPFVQSDEGAVALFKNKLEKYKINVTIRREMGRDIDGACGQLRKNYS